MDPQPNRDIMIAVMGATGTGKSTFINMASGGNNAVGNTLMSCTSNVTYSDCTVDGRQIVLIDTPGFDDTNVSDTDILKMIALQLEIGYEQGITLSGILYLHRISDTRMGGTSRRNFKMFRKLCGDDTLKNVLIVTTMWGIVETSIGEAREKELATNELLFKPALDKGAAMVRHDNTPVRAQEILRIIMKNHPAPLRIQRELVDEGKTITETAAGEELGREFAALVKKHKEEMQQVRDEMKEALAQRDFETKKELEECERKLQAERARAEREMARLQAEYKEEKRQMGEYLAELKEGVEEEKAARLEGQKHLEEMKEQLNQTTAQAAENAAFMRGQMEELRNRRQDSGGGGGWCVVQ
ncbi:hypothetical protein QCA50_014407 [Cerrena zonata]|uniref:G domain-containing protein n=1 Tax=Cerrena zonata TaxID=2478898 RepID=A0AAW0FTI0_9APHY